MRLRRSLPVAALILLATGTSATAAPTSYFTQNGIGSMTTSRGGSVAAPLPDGRVLIAGGHSGSSYVDSAEIFNPATGTFSSTGLGTMTTARFGAAAAPLPDGRVLTAGGYNGSSYVNSAEVFVPAPEPTSGGLDFGVAATGQSAGVRSLRVTNLGAQVLQPAAASLTGAAAADYTLVADRCAGKRLNYRDDCEIDVRFTPAASGARNAAVSLPSNATDTPVSFPLSGTGVAPGSGPPGPPGTPGPPGADGRDAQVSCKVKQPKKKKKGKKKTKVTCSVTYEASAANGRVRYTLSRRGEVLRRGRLRVRDGHARLKLQNLGRLPRGRYVLRIGGSEGATTRIRIR